MLNYDNIISGSDLVIVYFPLNKIIIPLKKKELIILTDHQYCMPNCLLHMLPFVAGFSWTLGNLLFDFCCRGMQHQLTTY